MTTWFMNLKVPTEEYVETDLKERVEKILEVQPEVEVLDFSTGTGLGSWSDGLSDIDIMVEAEPETAPWVLEVVLTTGVPVTIGVNELEGAELDGDQLEGVSL